MRIPGAVVRLHAPAIATIAENAAHTAAVALRRERDIATALEAEHNRCVALEPGLFDRRVERFAAAQSLAIDDALERCRRRIAALSQLSSLRLQAAELVFGAFV